MTSDDLERQQELTSKRLQPVLADSMPQSWPALVDMIVDDRDGTWFGVTGEHGRAARWVWCDSDGEIRGAVTLPANVRLAAVRDSMLYGVAEDENSVPSIRVYRLDASP